MTDMHKLQNGSDIRGVALPGVPGEEVNLTEERAKMLARGFAAWLAGKTGKHVDDLIISIGHDSRLSAKALKKAAIYGLTSIGVRVLDCDLASTPAMFMSTVFDKTRCDGAIMITASHLPFNRNGLKFFDKKGGLNKGDITTIIDIAEDDVFIAGGEGSVKPSNLMDIYSEHLRNLIIRSVAADDFERPLKGLKIVVDAGNGAGGFFAREVLAPLGADVSDSQFLEPDGNFPNHAPNPEDKKAMESISSRVLEVGADLGIIFDTDVDRSAAVDEKGREIARNGIVAMAAVLASEDHPGTTIVTDSITSDQLAVFLEENLGCKHLRFKRGYKNVINKAIELNEAGIDCQLAIETSGHAALKENYFLDDGAYLATKIVIKTAQLAQDGKTISSVIEALEEPAEAREVRFPIQTEDFASYGKTVLADLEPWAYENGLEIVEPNYEGVRIRFEDGWCLLRMSLHDPIMPLNIESNEEGGCERIAETLRPFFGAYDKLDTAKL